MTEWTDGLINEIMKDQESYREDYEKTYKAVAKSGAVYLDAPVPYHYIPRVYEEEDIENFKSAIAQMFSVVNTTIEAYLRDESIRRLYGFDPRLEALILLDHGYETKVPMGRFDLFYYDDGSYMFCELNTDGSSAMNEEAELSKILQDSRIANHIKQTHNLRAFELFSSWVDEVKTLYKGFSHVKEKATHPHVAIVDFVDKGASLEFQVFQHYFEDKGFKCTIVDPRDITCLDGFMAYEGKKIDIVYRRLVTKDLMDRYDEIPGFIEGLKSLKTCVIGSLKSQVVHTKLFFAMLHHEALRRYFTEEQLIFIDKTVPVTHLLKLEELTNEYIENRQAYILKPIDYYASKGVVVGQGTSIQAWRQILEEKAQEGYIIQKYCPLALRDSVLPNDRGGFDRVSFRTITGMYVYNQKVKGIYSRAGLNAIISGIHDGYTLSSLVATKK